MFNLEAFISKTITNRSDSLFAEDLKARSKELEEQIKGKRALVIGGAGTIGSSFIRALLKFEPAGLIVVDTNENGLTELTRDLRSSVKLTPPSEYLTYPISYSSKLFSKLLREKGPFDIIANFAAHKHVRSEKDHISIEAMVRNNVIDNKHLLDQLLNAKPKRFFCVSTDKAANPVNVMGASKKLMERILLAYSDQIHISTARFANVAFSNGSLLHSFRERLLLRQPLVAPLDIKRYFVSPEESGQLCLLACICSEASDIFFPNLSEDQMLTFSTIASGFLKAQGLEPLAVEDENEAKRLASVWEPGQPYPVVFFKTNTSGEKKFEEFFTDTETVDSTSFAQLGVIKKSPKLSIEEITQTVTNLEKHFAKTAMNKADVVELMSTLIPEFKHIETGLNLDQRM